MNFPSCVWGRLHLYALCLLLMRNLETKTRVFLLLAPFKRQNQTIFLDFFPLPMLHGMWDLSSPSKDGACAPCTGRAASTNGPRGRPSDQFNAVAQSCPTLCDPMACSTPGLPVHHQLPESTQIHVHWVIPSNHLILVIPLSSCPQSFPASGSFPMSQLFASGGQNIGVPASTSLTVFKNASSYAHLQWMFKFSGPP